jgi:hypothetical protein
MRAAGIHTVQSPADMGLTMAKVLSKPKTKGKAVAVPKKKPVAKPKKQAKRKK